MQRAPRFTFAVIADTHVNQREDHSASVYPSSKLANARARHVIDELNRLEPAFVIHLGDLVNPVPTQPAYSEAAEQFLTLCERLRSPLHLVAGNHDVGDKPLEWMPAPTVTDEHLALYERFFGRHYYSFDFHDCHFVVINAQILNSTLACEKTQATWLEADLDAARGKRIFLCSHYPLYVASPDELSSYDNIDEPARSWLLELLERHDVEALFAGHVHNFFYDRYADTHCYVLPSTAFVRHEYAEFGRVSPGLENGRNDTAKLGYFVVRVYEHGHVAQMVRTGGTTLAPDPQERLEVNRLVAVHSKESTSTSVGVDLRHPWAETIEIGPNGASDEFARKPARNDYPLLALWEMGLRRMRVPAQDIEKTETRRRMAILSAMGHVFTVYCYRAPAEGLTEILIEHAGLVDALEVVTPWASAPETVDRLATLKKATGFPIYLSSVQTEDDVRFEGGKFNLLISHGFLLEERDRLTEFWSSGHHHEIVDGFVFRVPRDTSPWSQIQGIDSFALETGMRAMAYIRTSSSRPAEEFVDDRLNANRTAEAVTAGLAAARTQVILDAFIDSDRGHYVRHGLLDRRHNPRLASRVVKHLLSALDGRELQLQSAEMEAIGGGLAGRLRRGDQQLYLILPGDRMTGARLPLATGEVGSAEVGQRIDLETGVIERWACQTPPVVVACEAPTLIIAGRHDENEP